MPCFLPSFLQVPVIDSLSPVSNQPPSPDSVTATTTFVAGQSNALVQLALDHIHTADARFNPVLFCGPTGSGKTLLLQTIEAHAVSSIRIMTAADFARDFADAVEVDSVDEFRQTFSNVSLLCLDDIQHLANKLSAQNELCLLIDEFINSGRLIVATSTYLPVDGGKLCPQLVSRLGGGLAVPIQTIDEADCRCILRALSRRYDVALQDDVTSFLAELATQQTKTSPAVLLNQCLTRLLAESDAKGDEISLKLARQLFTDSNHTLEPSLRTIVSSVAKCFNLTSKEIRGNSRKQPIVRARGVAMLLARSLTERSLEDLGRFFNNRDHSTVLHACRRTEALLLEDQDLNSLWHELRCSIPQKTGNP